MENRRGGRPYQKSALGRPSFGPGHVSARGSARWSRRAALLIALFLATGAAIGYFAYSRSGRQRGPAPEGMIWITGGTYWMGADDPSFRDSVPVHKVTLDSFWMDATEVTNAEFERFVKETGYVTVMERDPEGADLTEAAAALIRPGPLVFAPPPKSIVADNQLLYWNNVVGANWRHPEGPTSSIADRMNHPVVQLCWDDANAFAKWAGKRLPTEAEWEYAARGGLDRKPFAWGSEFRPENKWQANLWQGHYPLENLGDDGFAGTAPVRSFPPNGFGLFDMAGNVWEWCSDWYKSDAYAESPARNPLGPAVSYDPIEPGIPKRVRRGGSYLCADSYCRRYVPGARDRMDPGTAACNVGFRCVKTP